MIAIIDYGASNLRSVEKAFKYIGKDAKVTSDEKTILSASRLVLPGNGAFGDCMAALHKTGLIFSIKKFIETGKPFLGICIGMQVLFEESSEFGRHKGIGFLEGKVTKFSDDIIKNGGKIPHIGWNGVRKIGESKLFQGIDDGSFFYFVHSFYADALSNPAVAGVCDYYGDFTAAVEKDNISGVQFHPEKSLKAGLKLLNNFCEE